MRVFIYEYVCGGGLVGRPLPDSLAREGWAMLRSIVEDFERVERCEVVTTLDERYIGRQLATRKFEVVTCREDERRAIERRAGDCEWTLIIAPEFENVLLDRVAWAEQVGGQLLGSSSRGVAIAGDKFLCGQTLEQAGVPAVVGQVIQIAEGAPSHVSVKFPAVLKPRVGAGSQHTFLVPDADSLTRIIRQAADEGLHGDALLQPFLAGKPASVSLLVGSSDIVPLLAGEQVLSHGGRFTYLGGRIPLESDESARAIDLASHAVACVPGLKGYVGVDLVLGPDVVIEINPRLTTSYVALRVLCEENLARLMVLHCECGSIPPVRWKAGKVCFQPDGSLA